MHIILGYCVYYIESYLVYIIFYSSLWIIFVDYSPFYVVLYWCNLSNENVTCVEFYLLIYEICHLVWFMQLSDIHNYSLYTLMQALNFLLIESFWCLLSQLCTTFDIFIVKELHFWWVVLEFLCENRFKFVRQ